MKPIFPGRRSIAILFLIVAARDAISSENGIGENYPILRVEGGRLALYCDGNSQGEEGTYRQSFDAHGRLTGKEKRVPSPKSERRRWIYSRKRQTIDEILPSGAVSRHCKLNSPLPNFDRIVQVADSLIGVSFENVKQRSRHLSFCCVDLATGSVVQMPIGIAVNWEEPDVSLIIVINGVAYAAWVREVPVGPDEAMRRSHWESSLIADLVISRWIPGSNPVEHVVIDRDTPGLARLSIASQGDHIVIARDGQPPRIRVKAVKLSQLQFSPAID